MGVEFYEIQDKNRDARLAGGGVHGNAILTKIEPSDCFRVKLPVQFDWENPPKSMETVAHKEKRIGQRFALCAEFQIGDKAFWISSTHFEDKDGGVLGRYAQYDHLVHQVQTRSQENSSIIIAGDFNTSDHRPIWVEIDLD